MTRKEVFTFSWVQYNHQHTYLDDLDVHAIIDTLYTMYGYMYIYIYTHTCYIPYCTHICHNLHCLNCEKTAYLQPMSASGYGAPGDPGSLIELHAVCLNGEGCVVRLSGATLGRELQRILGVARGLASFPLVNHGHGKSWSVVVSHGTSKSTTNFGNLVYEIVWAVCRFYVWTIVSKHQDRFAASPCKEREEIDDSPCRFAAGSPANIARAGHRR